MAAFSKSHRRNEIDRNVHLTKVGEVNKMRFLIWWKGTDFSITQLIKHKRTAKSQAGDAYPFTTYGRN